MLDVERTIARLLWTVSGADAAATPGMRDLARNDLLTEAERARAAVLAGEETAHSLVTASWARRLGVPTAPASPYVALARRDALTLRRVAIPDTHGSTVGTAWLLGALHWHEQQSVRGFPRWTALFQRLGYPDLANDFAELTEQERGHVAFGRAVAERLAAEPLSPFYRAYQNHYRLTALAGAGVLMATYSRPLAQLEEAAR